jgi:hypothetical protein
MLAGEGIINSFKIEWSFKITEGGLSSPPIRGLENPRSFEEEMH